jgi:RNA polymerase sigma-70 factor (ECF subfamily)
MNDDGQSSGAADTPSLHAFEEVVQRYEAPLLRYAARFVSSSDAAQDIVQDTFIKLSLRWKPDADRSPAELSAWLYRVTHNLAVDHIRREARRNVFLFSHAAEKEHEFREKQSASAVSDTAEKAAALLRSLSLREQQVVTLKVYEERSYKEIAQITGLSESNVGYILHYAMQKLALAIGNTDAKRGFTDDTEI